MDRQLVADVGGIEVDYLNGPLRRGFNVRAKRQAESCASSGCSC